MILFAIFCAGLPFLVSRSASRFCARKFVRTALLARASDLFLIVISAAAACCLASFPMPVFAP
jgi:hypothetical protein